MTLMRLRMRNFNFFGVQTCMTTAGWGSFSSEYVGQVILVHRPRHLVCDVVLVLEL